MAIEEPVSHQELKVFQEQKMKKSMVEVQDDAKDVDVMYQFRNMT